MVEKVEFVDEVKQRIKVLGLKKSYVADKIEVSKVYFSYYLNGKRGISFGVETKLRKVLSL